MMPGCRLSLGTGAAHAPALSLVSPDFLAMFSRLLRNIGWNLFGQIAPLIAAVLAMPPLIAAIGKERFGLLAIGWMLVGYFSLFDFGLGRALTQLLARRIASGDSQQQQAELIWGAHALLGLLGLFAALLLWLGADWIILHALNVPVELRAEALAGMPWLAAALPAVVLSSGLRGVLEAHQAFKLLNLVRIPLGLLTFLAPLAVLPFSHQMPALLGMLAAARIFCSGLMLWACLHVQKGLGWPRFSGALLPQLLNFGGWLTLTNIISPLMVNMDRFLIGSVLSLTAVAYYTTPFEMVTRMLLLPGAVAGVCFPLFARFQAAGEWQELRQVYYKSLRWLALLLGPACALVCTAQQHRAALAGAGGVYQWSGASAICAVAGAGTG